MTSKTMDSTEALDENIIKVDVVQLKPSDGAGECLWNYTELGEMRTVESSVNEESCAELPSVVVAVLPMKEVAESTAEEQDSLALKSFRDTSKFQSEYSPGHLDISKSVKICNAVLLGTHQGMLQRELKPKTCQQINVQEDKSSTSTKLFECPICKARYSHQPSLIRHKRIHSGERPFVCLVCKKDFVHNTSLIFHMRTHTGEKPFGCSICNKRFSQDGTLRVHLRSHTGERPFECSICKKRFATKSQVSAHKLVHTNDKPFMCSFCERSFARRIYLIEHLQTHTGKRPHECSICQKGFSRKMYLAMHLQSHTDEK